MGRVSPREGWYSDPTGRFERRYWDGHTWTKHVRAGGVSATDEVESARKETKPPRRYSDASLLAAMETAGKLVDDD